MERKNKVMLAAAIGAVLVLVCSSAVQCTLVRAAGSSGESSTQEASASSQGQIMEDHKQTVQEAGNSSAGQEEAYSPAGGNRSFRNCR